MKPTEKQGTEFVTTHKQLEEKERRRCGPGTKRVGATCCKAKDLVTVTLRDSVCEDLSRAAYYLQTLPQRVAEVQAASEAVGEEVRRLTK